MSQNAATAPSPTIEQMEREYAELSEQVYQLTQRRDALASKIAQAKAGNITEGTIVAHERSAGRGTVTTMIDLYVIDRIGSENYNGIKPRYFGRKLKKDGTPGTRMQQIYSFYGPIRRATDEEIAAARRQ